MGRPQEAESAYSAAIALQKPLAADFPDRAEFRQELALTQNNFGNLLRETHRLSEAKIAFDAALALRKDLVAQFPSVADYRNELAGSFVSLADLANDRRDFSQAQRWLEEAQPHHQAALAANPQAPNYRRLYRSNLAALVRSLAGRGEQAAALQAAAKLRDLGWTPYGDAYDAACALAVCIPVIEKDDKASPDDRAKQVQFYADNAMAFLRTSIAKGYNHVESIKKDDDLKPLREREDYKKLLKELEAKK
jgi:tetratricopeptide (TPR) repeat protein